jgi:hypothetical protein
VPIEDALANDFPFEETSAWLRPNAPAPGIPLEFVPNQDLLFAEEDAAGNEVDMSTYFRYSILVPANGDDLTVYITQAACERLEEEGYDFAFRSGFTLLSGPDTIL